MMASLAMVFTLVLGACEQSRLARLEAKADRVESKLVRERDAVLGSGFAPAERQTRLDHLTNLRVQLGLANAGRLAAPRLLSGPDVETAYDALDEVYGVIDWNIPLGPSDVKRPFPAVFGPAGLNFQQLQNLRGSSTPPGSMTPGR